jgi:hypothetical protein
LFEPIDPERAFIGLSGARGAAANELTPNSGKVNRRATAPWPSRAPGGLAG